jgi:small subunit ribosomal protein S3
LGQKVHPYGFRLGYNRTWLSRWYSKRFYTPWLHQDLAIRREIKQRYYHASISRIEIERYPERMRVIIHAARPGLIIGHRGREVEQLNRSLSERYGIREVRVSVVEVERPELDAQIAAENIALQLERRVNFRRAMRRAVDAAIRFGAKGVRVRCKGRLAGAEIARAEWYLVGRLPLNTLRADIDYGFAIARTKYGTIGVKVWIYKGDKTGYLPQETASTESPTGSSGTQPGPQR